MVVQVVGGAARGGGGVKAGDEQLVAPHVGLLEHLGPKIG